MTDQQARLAAARIQPKIELAVLGFLVSLILKGTLDSIFGHSVTEARSWIDVYRIVWRSNPLELIVFLFAMLRFMYGAYRFHEELPNPTPRIRIWNVFFTVLLFVAFYLDGLTIKNHPVVFYQLFAVAHVVDLLWFVPMVRLEWLTARGRLGLADRAASAFVTLDVLTVVTCLGLLGAVGVLRGSDVPAHSLRALGLALLGVGALDVVWNHKFYLALPPDQRQQA